MTRRISSILLSVATFACAASASAQVQKAARAPQEGDPGAPVPLEAAYEGGYALRSADGDFSLSLGGFVQADGRFYLADANDTANHAFVVRRARPLVAGTAFEYFAFRLLTDFSLGRIQLYDGYVDFRPARFFNVRVGKVRPPLGLERLQSATAMFFVERGPVSNLSPVRDVGATLFGSVGNGALFYQAGVFNGATDNTLGDADEDDEKDVAVRVFLRPFRLTSLEALHEIGVGFAGSYGVRRGTPDRPQTPELRSAGQQPIFRYLPAVTTAPPAPPAIADGALLRANPQLFAFVGPVGVMGEYMFHQMRVTREAAAAVQRTHAWQVGAQVVLTGDRASYDGVLPTRPVGRGGYGAVSLEARVGQLDPATSARDAGLVNRDAAIERADSFGGGVTMHFNRAARAQLNFDRTNFVGGAPAGGSRPAENFLSLRAQYVL